MHVRVVERYVEDPARAKEAREYLYSLVRFLALRRLTGGDPPPGNGSETPG
jgi:hypothetical protein